MSAPSKKVKAANRKVSAEKKSEVQTHDGGPLENPGRNWSLTVGPMETISVAENAPLCQMVIQNLGPAIVEVRCETGDPMVLMPGKLTLMSAYGRIVVESMEEKWATLDLDFTPRTSRSVWY
jgi:hypothetical protein